MRKVTITTTVYSYSDLEPDAQQNALIALYDINVDYDWWEAIYEDAENIDLRITSFEEHSLEGEFCSDASVVAYKILANHYPECDTHQTATNFMDDFKQLLLLSNGDDDIEDIPGYEDLEAEFSRCLRGDYRIMLMKEYEYLTSEQAIVETIEANEYEFTQDGSIFCGFPGETTYQDIPA